MSKSIGNVLDPYDLLKMYGLDYVRYFMVAEVPFGNDGDFTHEAFTNRINSELANDFGNLAQRVLTFIDKNCNGLIPSPTDLTKEDEELLNAANKALPLCREAMDVQNLKHFCQIIINLAKLGNKYIDVNAPWALKKTDEIRMKTVLYVLAELIRRTAILLSPVIPTSCETMLNQLGCPPGLRSFQSINNRIPTGTKISTPQPVFPKIIITPPLSPTSSIPTSGTEKSIRNTKSTSDTKIIINSNETINNSDVLSLQSLSELSDRIMAKGDEIRVLKGQKATKAEIQPKVNELLLLKERYVYKVKEIELLNCICIFVGYRVIVFYFFIIFLKLNFIYYHTFNNDYHH